MGVTLEEISRHQARIQFTFVLPREMDQDLKDLESSTGLPRGAVFQRALSIYKLAIETRSTEGHVLTCDADGTLRNVTGLGI
jgi:hypothetical protein